MSSALANSWLTFVESLAPTSGVVLLTTGFQTVPGIVPQVEGNVIRATLEGPLAPGAYTVQWTAVSEDGASVQGSYQFGVNESRLGWLPVAGGVVAIVAFVMGVGWLARRRTRGWQAQSNLSRSSSSS